ncbi:hypothetical protein C41B8_16399 [Salinisphaera hydrothermalis C41B8]|uniref:Uncharacterized protein n=2 Tax=Salinisphaera TaxID=180541 RepID=A0A084IHF0_SALHC|nr:hypothetical protein C41B8_16399 [Salinisphaera hydrothermalis C41B8]
MRVVHLLGGGRLVNELGPRAVVHPKPLVGEQASFETDTYAKLFHDAHWAGLEPVGVEFYSHQMQATGEEPPEWKPYLRRFTSTWCCDDSAQKWAEIAHVAHQRKLALEWDLSRRIRYQLRTLSWRLFEVSQAYHNQLVGKLASGSFTDGGKFEDGFTAQMYLALHSFLIDACILRDYLADFIAKFILPKESGDFGRFKDMGQFRYKVLGPHKNEGGIASELWEATDENTNGWLAVLNAYRNIVVHSAPLEHAEARLFAQSYLAPFNGDRRIPAIRCPIPGDPISVKQARSSAADHKSFDELQQSYLMMARQEGYGVDGLEYVWSVAGRISAFSQQVSIRSHIEAQPITVTSKDTIGGFSYTTRN